MTIGVLRFFSRYCAPLKHIPLIPQAFDGALLLWVFLTRPQILDCIDSVRREVASWPDVSTRIHRFGGVEFQRSNVEIGHIHGNGVLDVRLTAELRKRVVADKTAYLHHTLPNSGWVSLPLRSQADSEAAISLLQMSYAINSASFIFEKNE
jgi:hypothetical protein